MVWTLNNFDTLVLKYSSKKLSTKSQKSHIRYRVTMFFFLLQGDSPYGQKEAYIKLEQLGEGSYATVFKGYSK